MATILSFIVVIIEFLLIYIIRYYNKKKALKGPNRRCPLTYEESLRVKHLALNIQSGDLTKISFIQNNTTYAKYKKKPKSSLRELRITVSKAILGFLVLWKYCMILIFEEIYHEHLKIYKFHTNKFPLLTTQEKSANHQFSEVNARFFKDDFEMKKKSKNIIGKKTEQLSNLLRTQHKNIFSDFHWVIFENKVFNVKK